MADRYSIIRDIQTGSDRKDAVRVIIANTSQEPIYEQIGRQIKAQVISGEVAEGEALPSIRGLARELGISVITTKRAYDELEAEGFINTVAGKGTYVAAQNLELLRERKMRIVEEKLAEAVDQARALGVGTQELMQMLRLLCGEET
jgi:GntR family transcriptional regulator